MMRPNVLLFGLVLIILGCLWSAAVWAHEPYTDWKIPGTAASCCDRRVAARRAPG